MKRRLNPNGRGCIVCGKILSRNAKYRCRECWENELRTRLGEKNSAWKGMKASNVAFNQVIIKRHGQAKECSNINCKHESKQYRWVRLQTRSGRRGGIWIQLCKKCLYTLSTVYKQDKKIIKLKEE